MKIRKISWHDNLSSELVISIHKFHLNFRFKDAVYIKRESNLEEEFLKLQ